jgi:hypothetical protein
MNSKKIPTIVAVLIVIIFVVFSRSSNQGGEGIIVDLGFNADLIKSKYSIVDGGSKSYSDPENRFSFKYPTEFTVGTFGDIEIGETILLQRAQEENGFQILISLFDEPGKALTVQRIQTEIPSLKMHDPRAIDFEGEVIGISFVTEDESFGRSREIWIAKEGFLYQMTTYEREQSLLAEVLSSWSFE